MAGLALRLISCGESSRGEKLESFFPWLSGGDRFRPYSPRKRVAEECGSRSSPLIPHPKDPVMKKFILSIATLASFGFGLSDVKANDLFRWTPPRTPSSSARTVYRPELRFSGFEYRTGGPSGGITLRFGSPTPVPAPYHHHHHGDYHYGRPSCRPCGCPHSHTPCRHSRDYDRYYPRDPRDCRDDRDYRYYRGW
jgi:hypothetical protein